MMPVIGGRTLPYTTSPHRGYSCSGSDGPATAILYSCSGSGASSRSGDAGRDIGATVDVAPTPWRMPSVALLLASSEAVLPPSNASSILCVVDDECTMPAEPVKPPMPAIPMAAIEQPPLELLMATDLGDR